MPRPMISAVVQYCGPDPEREEKIVKGILRLYYPGTVARQKYKEALYRIRHNPQFKIDEEKTKNYQQKHKRNPFCGCGKAKKPRLMRCEECTILHTREYHRLYKRKRDAEKKRLQNAGAPQD